MTMMTIITIVNSVFSFIVAFVDLADFIYEVHQDNKITATSANVTVIIVINM